MRAVGVRCERGWGREGEPPGAPADADADADANEFFGAHVAVARDGSTSPSLTEASSHTDGMSAVLALVCSASALLSSSSTQMVHESSGHRAQERRQRDGRRRADSYSGEQRAA